MKKVKERNFKKKSSAQRAEGGARAASRVLRSPRFFRLFCLLSLRSQPRLLRSMLAPQATRMLLRRGPHRSTHKQQRQHS